MAWADSRNGNFEIYLVRNAAGAWEQLTGSAEGAGLSATSASSRRPSVALDDSGQPVVAWTEFHGTGSDIYLASYDPTANGGLGGWIALGPSLDAGGISGTGAADHARLANTTGGLVVSWLDSSSGTTQIYAKQLVGGDFVALGASSASGTGVSQSASDVSDLTLATDGTKVAIAWRQVDAGTGQIHLLEFADGTWSELSGSTSGDGLSRTAGNSSAPSLAYHDGGLFVAWQDDTSGHSEIYATRFDGVAWVAAGPAAMSEGGVSNTHGRATRPELASGGGSLYMAWVDDLTLRGSGDRIALYAKRWDGLAFVEELLGDASGEGISFTGGSLESLSLAVNAAGIPHLAWEDSASGTPEVYVRANTFEITGAVYDTATLAQSVQQILDGNSLGVGDVIIVSGTDNAGFTVSSDDSGVTIVGAPGAQVSGPVVIDGANDVTLQGLTLAAGLVSTNSNRFTLRESSVSGSGVRLEGGSHAQIVHNAISSPVGIELTGGTDGATLEHNTIDASIEGIVFEDGGATGVMVRGNRVSAGSRAVWIVAPSSGVLTENDLAATGTALTIAAPFSGSIVANDIHGSAVGIAYAADAVVGGNRVHDNSTGITVTSELAFGASADPNEIYANSTGVQLDGQLTKQHIFDNTIGVVGTGILGGDDFDQANVIENNVTGIRLSGTVQFNRIRGNEAGIEAVSGQLIAHNVLYRNSRIGIHVSSDSAVRIINNTLYSLTGDNVRIENGSNNIEVRNNILWAEGGYDIYVANNSQNGFYSDYNTLHTSGTGKLVHWVLDFSDILDWQEDVHLFDLHSLGTTVINPLWAEPQFVSRARDDYRTFTLLARQRFSSPTIDAGDPRTDQALPALYENLLKNPGFESGLSDWTVNPGATTQSGPPDPFEGSDYFASGPVAVGSAVQTLDLVAAGFDATALDSNDLVVVFGGRVPSLEESARDRGQITLTFLDDVGVEIARATTPSGNPVDRWDLVSDRLAIPAGTRSVRYRFEAVRTTGTTNDSYLDNAFLYVTGESLAPDQGAYGNTTTDVTSVAPAHIALRFPDLYTDWESDRERVIRWDTYNNVDDAQIRIDLYRDGPEGPEFWKHINCVPDTGEFAWIPSDDSQISGGTYGLRVQVSLVGNPTAFDRGAETFSVPENTNTYYVNDADTSNDEYTTTAGSNRHTGRVPEAPKPSPINLLRIYELRPTLTLPNKTLFVDTGDYQLLQPIVLSGEIGIADDEGFLFTGPSSADSEAVLRHANPLTDAPIIELRNADSQFLSHLTLVNAQVGVLVCNGSVDFSGSYLSVSGHDTDGIRVLSGATVASLDHITSFDNSGDGIYIGGPLVTLSNSVVYGNDNIGIALSQAGHAAVSHNEVYGNLTGIFVSSSLATTVSANLVYGNSQKGISVSSSPGSTVSENVVHGNLDTGIFADRQVLVTRNTVYGHTGIGDVGISGGTAASNVVYGNYNGVTVGVAAVGNRVYNNSNIGILASGGSTSVQGNTVYSNSVGVKQTSSGAIENNLIYANSNQAILAVDGGWTDGVFTSALTIINNTVFQPMTSDAVKGAAVRIEGNSKYVQLRNNILWVEEGYDISVANDSRLGFQSDYNILYTTGNGQIALWANIARTTLAAWQNTAFTDQNSLFQDPLFVDPDGPDNTLGYGGPLNDGRDDDLHLQSIYGSYHGGSLVPVVDADTGLPVFLVPTEYVDAFQSSGIDRGDASDDFVNEPAPNGGFINIGAYGNTEQASKSPLEYVLVTTPDGDEAWPAQRNVLVRWRSDLLTSEPSVAQVDIELLRDGDASFSFVIAENVVNDGAYEWLVPNDAALVPPGDDYRVRVTRTDNLALTDISNNAFAIAPPVNTFYVNIDGDPDLTDNEYATAAGAEENDGLSPATPANSIQAVLLAHDLGPGDTIFVDSGVYSLSANILITAQDAGVTIVGPTEKGHEALLDRGSTSTGSYVFELQSVDGVTLRNLSTTGGQYGLFVKNSDDVTFDHLSVSGASTYGIYAWAVQYAADNFDSDRLTVVNSTIFGNGSGFLTGSGIYVPSFSSYGPKNDEATIVGNTIFDNPNGIKNEAPNSTISDNAVFDNYTGIDVRGTGTTVSGNLVHDNTGGGISASWATSTSGQQILVTGNTVYANNDGITISGTGSQVIRNTVHGNYNGITVGSLSSAIGNRVYDNRATGILASGSSTTVQGNTVYSNSVGVKQSSYGEIFNNLIYANTHQGILVVGRSVSITNNTVYQPKGDAIRVGAGNATGVWLSNNILWVEEGYDISVANDSQLGFRSDYNLLYTTGSGKLGLWQGQDFTTQVDWFYELGFDGHSQTTDPLFVGRDGVDDILGFSTVPVGMQILDDEDVEVEFNGAWSERINGGYQSDYWTTGDLADTAVWRFTGLTPGTYQLAATWTRGRIEQPFFCKSFASLMGVG